MVYGTINWCGRCRSRKMIHKETSDPSVGVRVKNDYVRCSAHWINVFHIFKISGY